MSRYVIWLIILCVILLVLVRLAHSAEPDGWEMLLKNKPQEAAALFRQDIEKKNDKLESIEGLYQAETMSGRSEEAYQALKSMVEQTAGSPLQGLFLLRLGVEAELSGNTDRYNDFVKDLDEASGIDNYTSTVLALILNKVYLRENNFQHAAAALKKSTRIEKVSRILGPVYIPSQYGLAYKTGLEANLIDTAYSHSDNVRTNSGGKIVLGDILPSDGRTGVAYVYLTLNSDRETEAALDFFSKSICRIWLNGEMIYSTSIYSDGFIAARNSRLIRLHKGKNLLLVKAFRSDVLQIGLREKDEGGRLDGVSVLDYVEADWKDVELKDYSGRIFSQEYLSPINKELEAHKSIAGDMWRNFYYSYTKNFDDGIELNNQLLAEYPSSAIINYRAGEFYQGYQNYFENKNRTLIMCERYMREALKEWPDFVLPKIMLSKIYLANKQESSALRLLQEIEEENSGYPWVFRALVGEYSKKGWIDLAEQAIGKYREHSSDNDAVIINMYLDIEEFSKAEKLYETALADNRLSLFSRYSILLRMKRYESAEGVLKEWYTAFPEEERRYLKSLINLAQEKNDLNRVGRLLREMLESNPHNTQIMKSIGENAVLSGSMSEGVEWFRTAHKASLEFQPAMPGLMKRIEYDSNGEFELADYDLSLSDIDVAGVKKEDHDRASYANLLNVRVVRVFEDLSSEAFEHRAFKIFDNAGVSELAELNVGSGEIIECRTISSDGVEYIPESAENVSLDKAISMYNASIGSSIEYSKRWITNPVTVFTDRFEFESLNNPVIKSRFVLIIPKKMLSRISIDGLDPDVVEKDDEVVLSWQAESKSGVEPEEFMPKPMDVLEGVNIKIYSSELEAPVLITRARPDLITDELVVQAVELCKNKTGTREKVAAIYQWIAENIQNNGEAVSARDAFILKAGNATSNVNLMKAMLAAVGITAYPVWSNVPYSVAGRLNDKDRLAAMADFTLPVILRIKNEDSQQPDIWVRITEDLRENRPANIGTFNQGALALELSPYGVRLSAIRENSLETVKVLTPQINILSNGTAEVSGGVEFFGSAAASARPVFYNSVHARQYAAQVASKLFPGLSEAEYSYPDPDDMESGAKKWDEPLLITCKGRVLNYCVRRGDDLYLNTFSSGEFVKNLIVKLPRKNPVWIQMDVQNSVSRSYTIPEGYVYRNVPVDRVIKSTFGLFLLDYNVNGRSLVVSGSILIPAQEIDPDNVALYNEFLSEIKEAATKGIVIEKIADNFGQNVIDYGEVAPVEPGEFDVKKRPESIKSIISREGI